MDEAIGSGVIIPQPYSFRNPHIIITLLQINDGIFFGLDGFQASLLRGLVSASAVPSVVENVASLEFRELEILASKLHMAAITFKTFGAKGVSLLEAAEAPLLKNTAKDTLPASFSTKRRRRPSDLKVVPSSSEAIITPPPSTSQPPPSPPKKRFRVVSSGGTDLFDEPSTDTDPAQSLFQKLGICSPLPAHIPPERAKFPARSKSFRENILERHINACCVTGIGDESSEGQAVHIVPRRTCVILNPQTMAFWEVTGLLIGEEARDYAYQLVGKNPDNLKNSVLLWSPLRKHYDKGDLYLLPEASYSNHYRLESAGTKQIAVNFRWKGRKESLSHFRTRHPPPMEQQPVVDEEGEISYKIEDVTREIFEGERIVLFTNDPVHQPLPDGVLLELNA